MRRPIASQRPPTVALCDAFDLGRMQGIDLIFVIGLLRQELFDPFEFGLERLHEIGLPLDLALDVAHQPARSNPHLSQEAHRLFVAAAVD